MICATFKESVFIRKQKSCVVCTGPKLVGNWRRKLPKIVCFQMFSFVRTFGSNYQMLEIRRNTHTITWYYSWVYILVVNIGSCIRSVSTHTRRDSHLKHIFCLYRPARAPFNRVSCLYFHICCIWIIDLIFWTKEKLYRWMSIQFDM